VAFVAIGQESDVFYLSCKTVHEKNAWAKVRRHGNNMDIVEILGDVGDDCVENRVWRLHCHVLPCKYPPPEVEIKTVVKKSEVVYGAITVDDANTLDRDDAISFSRDANGTLTVGIHISDVSLSKRLLTWAEERGASAYSLDGTTFPMLPPCLSHNELSLVEGTTKPCISLFLEYSASNSELRITREALTMVHVKHNATYDSLPTSEPEMHNVLQTVTGTLDPHEQIEKLMVLYNTHFASWTLGPILFRVQDSMMAAAYTHERRPHVGMPGAPLYGHFTSPIRRFADVYNQSIVREVLLGNDPINVVSALEGSRLDTLNHRMQQLHRFHYRDVAIGLAYAHLDTPAIMEAVVDVSVDGRFVTLTSNTLKRRMRLPIHDSFCEQRPWGALRAMEKGSHARIELMGIVKRCGAELRVRMADVSSTLMNPTEPQPSLTTETPKLIISLKEHHGSKDVMEQALGHALDDFQTRALDAISSGDDLLGMAPTGSGKTAVALMAVLLAARKGLRAIYTSPIKALSNQKFAEFEAWFPGRVSLITGDIQHRATDPGGDGLPELLIMTSEILANKLERGFTDGCDPDLANVSVVVMDEVHYINDPERGGVWERAISALPTDVQMVALSATIREPERFCEWLNQRRTTRLVRRSDRHVPLHVGGFSSSSNFVELFGTHDPSPRAMASADYDALYRGKKHFNVVDMVDLLDRDDKLPAIVFFMGRDKCVAAAESVTRNMLLPPRPKKPLLQHGWDAEEYRWASEEHGVQVAALRNRQRSMYDKYMGPIMRAAPNDAPLFADFFAMIDRGVAYHHAGMLPVMREYVELLFQARLVRVVFATETLGVGINMPARSVVFAQLDKPSGADGINRMLRPDEFWQMAGRSGRRGMDDRGFVIYHPFDSKVASAREVTEMLTGKMATVESKLCVDHEFVLRRVGFGAESALNGTLLSYELSQKAKESRSRLTASKSNKEDENIAYAATEVALLRARLSGRDGYFCFTPRQRRTALAQVAAIEAMHGVAGLAAAEDLAALESEVGALEAGVGPDWDASLGWLAEQGFVMLDGIKNASATPKGLASACMCDGQPLVRGAALFDGLIDHMGLEDLATWLWEFASPQRIDKEVLHVWLASGKNVRAITPRFLPASELGAFVRTLLRIVGMVEEMKPAILGLQKYELYNRLANHSDRLTVASGIIGNRSLYMRL
jgi:superfamily II DNA/RNA helicase